MNDGRNANKDTTGREAILEKYHTTNCNNCDMAITSNYCPDCGQPASLKRIDGKYILHEIEHVLHFERGILYTIKELITNPGQNVRNYLTKNRSRLVKPIIFIIVTSLIYSFCNYLFHFEDGYINFDDNKSSTTSKIFKWVQGHYGYANIIMGGFIAFWTKMFFKKYKFNFFEILILLCFVMGMGMLVYAVCGILQGITHVKLMQPASLAFIAYVLGMITFSLACIVLGNLIDFIILKI